MRSHAKAPSAGSTEGSGKGRSRKFVSFLGAALLASLVLGVALGSAAIPTVSVEDASEVQYTTADVAGTVDPQGQFTTYRFQYISEAQFQENLTNSLPGFEGAATGIEAGTEAAEPVAGELTGLNPHTTYHLRLVAENGDGPAEAVAADTFETLEVADPIVTIDPVTTFTGTSAHFTGAVDPNAPAGPLSEAAKAAYDAHWEFQCTPQCPGLAGGLVKAEEGSKAVSVNASGLEPNTAYEVKLVASNASGPKASEPKSFQTNAIGPDVETMPAFALQNGTEALVGGRVNPKNSATTYWIEYGTTAAYGSSTVPASAGSGGGVAILTQKITGLTPGATYHVRLVAENSVGETQGTDMNFESTPPAPAESCPNATLRSENRSTELPDCRAYEQVSPVEKNGYDAGTNGGQPVYVAAEDGSAASFESYGGLADATSASVINPYLSRRGSSGWTTQALAPPADPSPFVQYASVPYFTGDMSKAVLVAPPGEPQAPGATAGTLSPYLRDNTTGTFRSLASLGPLGRFNFGAASANAEHIIFESNEQLTPDAPATASKNLYEWSDGELRLVTLRPDGTPAPAGGSIEAGTVYKTTHAISEDGSRVVFKTNPVEGPPVECSEEAECPEEVAFNELYLYEEGQPTVQISASQRTHGEAGASGSVTFWGASADTSQIFFTSSASLTDDAPAEGGGLYRYNADTKTLTDLTANPLSGIGGVEGVAAISDDGSNAYFFARGQFIAGQGDPNQPNLYRWHNGTISLIAADTEAGTAATYSNLTNIRLTANDRYLTFATPMRLTAFDNAGSGEVYRYDSVLDRLTCVSCSPDGETPTGSASFPEPPVRSKDNQQPGAAEDGRVFFDTTEALVPGDVNEKPDVYEWKDGRQYLISSGTSGDPSFYASASESGEDVFFATREQLVPADQDQLLDLYDAHIGGGFPKGVRASLCEGVEACHGPANSAPAFADPASGSVSGASQLSPSARRLRAARKACGKKPRKARAKCRASAKKRFTKAGRAH